MQTSTFVFQVYINIYQHTAMQEHILYTDYTNTFILLYSLNNILFTSLIGIVAFIYQCRI